MTKPRWPFVHKILTILVYVHLGIGIATSSTDPLVQQRLDKVLRLPGQSFNLSFAHYAGYINVNEDSGRALFYWFIEAAEDPDSKPLVLWLNGGQASKFVHTHFVIMIVNNYCCFDLWFLNWYVTVLLLVSVVFLCDLLPVSLEV
jgi:hypothetical protein